jgi:hypothetical protein
MHPSAGSFDSSRPKSSPMDVTPTCFSKSCSKPRFLDYYVCEQHFVLYAAPRYTESMVINPEPIADSEFWRIYLEATSSSQPEQMARKSPEREITKEARRA